MLLVGMHVPDAFRDRCIIVGESIVCSLPQRRNIVILHTKMQLVILQNEAGM